MSKKRCNNNSKSNVTNHTRAKSSKHDSSPQKQLDLSLTDFTCPICLEVLIEPVQMPCKHELCLPCFKSMTDLTNLSCPMCRMRISTWSRQASISKSLVNQDRWNFIKKTFPKEIKNRLEGKTAQIIAESIEKHKKGLTESTNSQNKIVSEPGEIRKEYQEYLKREQERLRAEKENEEKKSLDFIQNLIRQEENISINDYLNLLNSNRNQIENVSDENRVNSIKRTNSSRRKRAEESDQDIIVEEDPSPQTNTPLFRSRQKRNKTNENSLNESVIYVSDSDQSGLIRRHSLRPRPPRIAKK